MKMTLKEVQMTAQNLAEVITKKVPYQLTNAIKKNLYSLQAELRLAGETRTQLAQEFAKKDENGEFVIENGCYTFDEGEQEKFVNEVNELFNSEVEVDIKMVSEAVLERLEDTRYDVLTTEDLIKIDFMIIEAGGENDDK